MTRIRAVLAVAVLVGLHGIVLAAPRAHAAAEDAGKVTVTQAGSTRRISAGQSSTPFDLRLPKGAACPGDSVDDDYRVQSFIVPVTTDLTGLRFKSQGPDVAGGWALYKLTTSAYIQEQTADAPLPKEPGPILPLPTLTFEVFRVNELTPGSYRMGVACSRYNDTVRVWSAPINIVSDPDDGAGFAWELPGVSTDVSGSPTLALGALGVFAIGGGGLALTGWLKSRRHGVRR